MRLTGTKTRFLFSSVGESAVAESNISSMDNIQNLFKETIAESMEDGLETELDDELGYSRYDYRNKSTENSRNGHSSKTLRTSFGDVEVTVPRDRKGEFEPQLLKKNQTSISQDIEEKILSMYAKGMMGITGIETIGDRFTINASLPAPAPITFNMETINLLLPSAFTIAILGAIESLLSATVADGVTGDKHNSNTELIAQGAANIIVPIFGGIPVTGAIARTMTNINNGGRTPVAGIIHAIVLLLILLFLGPLTKHIPMACLAGVLIIVSYNMSEWRTFRSLMKNPKSDVSVLLVTFFLTVIFDLTIAIEIGLLIAMLFFMRRVAETTHVSVTTDEIDLSDEGEIHHDEEVLSLPKGVEVYEIDGPFFFGVANKFDGIMKSMGDKPKVRIIRMRKVSFIDSTGLHNLESLFRLSEAEHIHMILSGVNEHVHRVLTKSGFDKKIGAENICSNINEAVEKAKAAVQD